MANTLSEIKNKAFFPPAFPAEKERGGGEVDGQYAASTPPDSNVDLILEIIREIKIKNGSANYEPDASEVEAGIKARQLGGVGERVDRWQKGTQNPADQIAGEPEMPFKQRTLDEAIALSQQIRNRFDDAKGFSLEEIDVYKIQLSNIQHRVRAQMKSLRPEKLSARTVKVLGILGISLGVGGITFATLYPKPMFSGPEGEFMAVFFSVAATLMAAMISYMPLEMLTESRSFYDWKHQTGSSEERSLYYKFRNIRDVIEDLAEDPIFNMSRDEIRSKKVFPTQ